MNQTLYDNNFLYRAYTDKLNRLEEYVATINGFSRAKKIQKDIEILKSMITEIEQIEGSRNENIR